MAVLVVAVLTLFASIAAGTAPTRAAEPRTTVVPYTPPEPCCEPGQNYDSAADCEVRNPAVGSDSGPGWLLLMLAIAAIFFVIGRCTASSPPAPEKVRADIKKAFEEQVRLGEKVYNWNKLAPVLGEAETAVFGVLKKHKLVPKDSA